MTKKAKSVLFSAVFLSVMIASGAMADGKVYAGNNCQVTSGSPTYSLSAIGNGSSSSWLYLYCPIVNDSLNGTETAWMTVKDQNNNTDGDIRCRMYSIYHNAGAGSNYGWVGDYEYSSGYGSNWQQLNFDAISANNRSAKYLYCRIPSNDIGVSYIGEYYIDE